MAVASAQPSLPDTAAGHALKAWLQAFDRGDRAAYRRFLQTTFPSGVKDLDQDVQFREMTGGFNLRKVEESTPRKIVALVQERLSDQFGRLTLQVADADPNRIASLEVGAIPRPLGFPLPHLSQSQLTASLRSKLARDVASDRFSGAVLVAHGGTPIFAQAYGLADRKRRIRPRPLVFRISSRIVCRRTRTVQFSGSTRPQRRRRPKFRTSADRP